MTTPVNPDPNNPDNIPPTNPSEQPNPSGQFPTSYMDPTGVWAKFLSTPGQPATADEVKRFLGQLMIFFNSVVQAQMDASAKRALDELKKAEQGEDD